MALFRHFLYSQLLPVVSPEMSPRHKTYGARVPQELPLPPLSTSAVLLQRLQSQPSPKLGSSSRASRLLWKGRTLVWGSSSAQPELKFPIHQQARKWASLGLPRFRPGPRTLAPGLRSNEQPDTVAPFLTTPRERGQGHLHTYGTYTPVHRAPFSVLHTP